MNRIFGSALYAFPSLRQRFSPRLISFSLPTHSSIYALPLIPRSFVVWEAKVRERWQKRFQFACAFSTAPAFGAVENPRGACDRGDPHPRSLCDFVFDAAQPTAIRSDAESLASKIGVDTETSGGFITGMPTRGLAVHGQGRTFHRSRGRSVGIFARDILAKVPPLSYPPDG